LPKRGGAAKKGKKVKFRGGEKCHHRKKRVLGRKGKKRATRKKKVREGKTAFEKGVTDHLIDKSKRREKKTKQHLGKGKDRKKGSQEKN